jgi:hypothetical protein
LRCGDGEAGSLSRQAEAATGGEETIEFLVGLKLEADGAGLVP